MKLAIVHDYLNQYGGAERVIEALHEIYPNAPVYTSIFDKKKMPNAFSNMDIRTTFLQRIWFASRISKLLLPLYPAAFKSIDLSEYDVILSSSSSFSKFVKKGNALHICYCYTPTRFIWRFDEYAKREQFNPLLRIILKGLIFFLKKLDLEAVKDVDEFIAISNEVKDRIKNIYGRSSKVIYPPVEVKKREIAKGEGNYFLIVSRLRGYKRIDLAIEAFNRLKLPLVIVGSGDMERKLHKLAAENIEFTGRLSDKRTIEYFKKCKAVIFPGEEDFGIVPLEAQSFGKPVIAYGKGGALETVIEGKTGIFFQKQNISSMIDSVCKFSKIRFSAKRIRANALLFDKAIFKKNIAAFIKKSYSKNIDKYYS